MATKNAVDCALSLLSFDRPNIDQLLERASELQQTYRKCHVCIVMDLWLSAVLLPSFDKQEDQPQGISPTSDDILKKLRETTERLRNSVLKRAKSRKKYICNFCLENTDYHDLFAVALKHFKAVVKAGIGPKSMGEAIFDDVTGPLKQLILQVIQDDKTPKACKVDENWLECMRYNFEFSKSRSNFKIHNFQKKECPYRNMNPRKKLISKEKGERLVEGKTDSQTSKKAANQQVIDEQKTIDDMSHEMAVSSLKSPERMTSEKISQQAGNCAEQSGDHLCEHERKSSEFDDRNGKTGKSEKYRNLIVTEMDLIDIPEDKESPAYMTYYMMYYFHHEVLIAYDIMSVKGKLLFDALCENVTKKNVIQRTADYDQIQLMGSKIRRAVSCLSKAVMDGYLDELYQMWPDFNDLNSNRSFLAFNDFLALLIEQMTLNINDTCGACYGAAVFDAVIEEDILSLPKKMPKKTSDLKRLMMICNTLEWISRMINIRDMFRHFLMDVYFVDHCYNCSQMKDQVLFDDVIIVNPESFREHLKNTLKECKLFGDQ